MQLEQLEVSPGNTLRDRNRRQQYSLSPPVSPTGDISPVPVVEMLQESPGNRTRRRTAEKQEERNPVCTIFLAIADAVNLGKIRASCSSGMPNKCSKCFCLFLFASFLSGFVGGVFFVFCSPRFSFFSRHMGVGRNWIG